MEKRPAPGGARASTCAAVFSTALIVGFLLAAPGCAIKGPPPLEGVTENVDQPDIPVPRGFKRVYSWSFDGFADTEGHFRSWEGQYVGLTKRREIVDWYRDRMPDNGWLLKSSHASGSKNVLEYTKGNVDDAVVTVSAKFYPDEDTYKTVVTAEVKPTAPEELQVEDVLPTRGAIQPVPTSALDTPAAGEIDTPAANTIGEPIEAGATIGGTR